ncbi:polymorphic toxin-type HINT domain-containing protein [Planctopirus hydrillae]|uniref:polymorphic toxin-type HINT domain-containing protein n=1 Tax=Planctopirus hydrillae TaxID=1841610 RepID=UPI0010420911|nr:polymorphic toxin-type HINT domain-containing protein [Planctopirus hydrillae]
MVDYTYADASSPGSDPTGDHGYSEYEGVFESGTAHDLAEWNVTFSNPMSLINQALAPYNYYNLPFIPQAFTNAMGGYEPSYLGDWHLSSEGWASDTQYYKYYENDRTGDWRIDYWDHKPAENETPQRSEYGGPSYDSIQQEAYAAQQQAQSQANQTPPDEAPAAKSADQNRLEEEQSASGSEGGSYTPSNPVAPGNEVGQASRNAMDRAYERLAEQQSNPHIRDLLNRNEHDLGTLIDRAPYRPSVDAPVLQEVGEVKKPTSVGEKTANGVDIETLPYGLAIGLRGIAQKFIVTQRGKIYDIFTAQHEFIGIYTDGAFVSRGEYRISTLQLGQALELYGSFDIWYWTMDFDDVFEKIGTPPLDQQSSVWISFLDGLVQGFWNDGVVGTLQSIPSVLETAVHVGLATGPTMPLYLTYQAIDKYPVADAMMSRINSLYSEIMSLDDETKKTLFQGDLEQLRGKVSDLILDSVKAARSIASDIFVTLMAGPQLSANDYAYISGRILGYLLFEVLLALCTEGTVSALKHSASAERAALGIAKHLPKGFDHKPLTARILHLYDNALVIIGKSCFVAGTPVRTADGWKPIEAIRKGERVWSRPEGHPTAANRLQVVEDVFQFQATAIRLIVGGMTIETTPQHPFFVADTGWTAATDLKVGMSILTEDGNSVLLEAIDNQEYDAVVYNLRVEEDHTYFVGKPEWGFAVWVHNAYTVRQMADKRWEIVDETINLVRPEIFDEKDYQKAVDLKDKLNRDAANANPIEVPPTGVAQSSIPTLRTGDWGQGSFSSAAESLQAHFAKHGREVDAKDIDQYLRKAEEFARNKRGATRSPVDGATPGVTRFKKNNKYIDIDSNGKIISFGAQ